MLPVTSANLITHLEISIQIKEVNTENLVSLMPNNLD